MAGVHQSQGVPDHTHFDLFVNRTGDVFKNSRRHLGNRDIRQPANQPEVRKAHVVLTSCSCSILMLGLELTSSSTGFRFFISRMSKPKI